MPDIFFAGIAAVVIASIGLWWFRLVLPSLSKHPKVTRYGIYAALWFAYFILTLIVIGRQI
ncbi:MAG: hypothetical protein GXP04_01475 [Alphaproteobacteria bacterium]|nr:hypothetical protein [Marinicaulis sp.]NOX93792.1 hypothetical protein [Alphaproteobacteria bacterium]